MSGPVGTASRGRRRAPAPTALWPIAAAVLVTVAALVLAGLAGPASQSSEQGVGAVAVARTFACPGGLPGTRATGGRATAAARPMQVGSSPRVVEVGAGHASEGYAVQESRAGGVLAASPCPEPRAQWWLTGLGASGPHRSRVLLANPRAADALVDVHVFGPQGPVDVPGLRGLEVRHGESRVLDLSKVAPSRGELAVHVSASRGLVSAVAADSYASGLLGRPMQEWVPGAERPSRHGYLTGAPDRPDDATLVLANPGGVESLVTLRVAGRRGTFTLPGHEEVRVPPGGTTSVDVGKAFDGRPTSLRVDAERPVTATLRTVTGGDLDYAGTAPELRQPSALGAPEGADAEVQLTSTGTATRVRATGYDARGRSTGSHRVAVKAGTTVGLGLKKGTRSVVLQPGNVPVVAGLVVKVGRGVAGLAFPPAGTTSRAPAVRPE